MVVSSRKRIAVWLVQGAVCLILAFVFVLTVFFVSWEATHHHSWILLPGLVVSDFIKSLGIDNSGWRYLVPYLAVNTLVWAVVFFFSLHALRIIRGRIGS